jgi:hypothetical protein
MAGPGRPGPASKGRADFEYQALRGRVLKLHTCGWTHAQIAAEVGLERSTVTKMLPRIKKGLLTDDDRSLASIFVEVERLNRLKGRLYGQIMSEELSREESHRAANEYLRFGAAFNRVMPISVADLCAARTGCRLRAGEVVTFEARNVTPRR